RSRLPPSLEGKGGGGVRFPRCYTWRGRAHRGRAAAEGRRSRWRAGVRVRGACGCCSVGCCWRSWRVGAPPPRPPRPVLRPVPRAVGARPGSPAGAAPTAAPALRDVRPPYPSAASTFAPLWAAYEFGIFEQYGLRATEPIMISGGPANAQALTARDLEASYTA